MTMLLGPNSATIFTFLVITTVIAKTLSTREIFPFYDEQDLDEPGASIKKIRLHPKLSDEAGPHRKKRGVIVSTNLWHSKIPVVFHNTSLVRGDWHQQLVMRILKRIADHVCVKFFDVTKIWNPKDDTWFTSNGYDDNVYIRVGLGKGCTAGGRPKTKGPHIVNTCNEPNVITHELLHVMNVPHMQQVGSRINFISINYDNVTPELRGTYKLIQGKTILDTFFDAQSRLLYGRKTWSSNGLWTFSIIKKDMYTVDHRSETRQEYVNFYELSQIYKCRENYCADDKRDCGEGYLTIVKDVCRCVCPTELDPDENCQKLINKASTSATWPPIPMGVLAGGATFKCPSGLDSQVRWLNFTNRGVKKRHGLPVDLPITDQTVSLPICVRTLPEGVKEDWNNFPRGSPGCVISLKGTTCGGDSNDFSQYEETLPPIVGDQQSLDPVDIISKNKKPTLKLCCKEWDVGHAFDFPNKEPFRLLSTEGCPKVKGILHHEAYLMGRVNTVTGTKSIKQCYYIPPTYDCNQVITLDASHRSETVTTPGFGSGREPNKRCLYSVHVPKYAKIRISFHTFDIYRSDKVTVKRFHKLQEPRIVTTSDQIVSTHNYLVLEYWSFWEKAPKNQGLNFTASVYLAEESCYNEMASGQDYMGETSLSEYYEECLPWAQTMGCTDFPTEGMAPVWLLLSGNKCRNPDGWLEAPWCFIYKNGTNCPKRFCDVCNIKDPVDVLKNCDNIIRDDPTFCEDSLQRYQCFVSCGFQQQHYTDRATCQPPTLPSDGVLAGEAKEQYKEGEAVRVNCSSDVTYFHGEMMCTKEGWTELAFVCFECPAGWAKHRDRCLSLFSHGMPADKAEDTCKSYGTSGTLFQIRDKDDGKFLYELISKDKRQFSNYLISGRRTEKSEQWIFTSTEEQMTYFNWAKKHLKNLKDDNKLCVEFVGKNIPDRSTWIAIGCNRKSRYVCQVKSQVTGQGGEKANAQQNQQDNRKKLSFWGACSGVCPPGWRTYGDRCVGIINARVTGVKADFACQEQMSSGLFQVRTETDHKLLLDLRKHLPWRDRGSLWVSGSADPVEGKWRFTNTQTEMTYFNWSHKYSDWFPPKHLAHLWKRQCVVVLADWNKDGGQWMPEACDGPSHNYACQISRGSEFKADKTGPAKDVNCKDQLGHEMCQCLLTVFPRFCQAEQTSAVAKQRCSASCGQCGGSKRCKDPQEVSYRRTSAKDSIGPGEVMEFSCSSGHYYFWGHLALTCSLDGHLLGQAPICQTRRVAIDWNINLIRSRSKTFPGNHAILLDHDGYRMPFDGRITKLYFYCEGRGSFHFLVYRRKGGKLTFVGSHLATCKESTPWSQKIAEEQQIAVRKDDIIGIFANTGNLLAVDRCTGKPNELLPNPFMEARKLTEVVAGKFNGTLCMIPSVGARVTPWE